MKIENKGGVYFIKNSYNNQIKIGCSNEVNKRFEAIKSEMYHLGLDFELTFLGAIYSDKYYIVENYLHNKYKSKRKIGEWFEISEEDVFHCINSFDETKIQSLVERESIETVEFDEITSNEYVIILGNRIYKEGLVNLNKCKLSATEKGMLYCLFEISEFENNLEINIDTLTDEVDMSERNIRRYIKKYDELGILRYESLNGKLEIFFNDKILKKYEEGAVA